MAIDIRRRMSGEHRRGDLRNLVRSRSLFRRLAEPDLVAPVLHSIERYIRFVSQLAPETGLENKSWVQSNGVGTPGFVLHTYWDPLGTPTTIDANGNRIFDYKMNGIRFAIDGHNQPGLWTSVLNQHFTSPNFPVTGKSAVLPASGSHVLLNLSQIDISNGGFNVLNGWSSAFTTHYRVWIDGVDKTGIVTLGSVFPHTIQLTSVPSRVIGGLLPVSITNGSYPGKSVWFDIWVTVRVVNRTRFHIGDPTLASSYYPACQIDPYAQHHRSRFNSANVNAKRFVGDQYRITFADNGPGGLSTLNVANGGGWALTESNAGFSLVKAGTGAISLNWTTESPVLTCLIDAKLNQPYAGNNAMRYLPAGSMYSHRNNNNTVIDYGEWNPQGSTVFNQVARALGSTYYTKGSSTTPASFFTEFPSTITVEKI